MGRNFITGYTESIRRHVRAHASRALLSSVSSVAVLAGFLSAAGTVWPLWLYLLLCAVGTAGFLTAFGAVGIRVRYGLLAATRPPSAVVPQALALRAGGPASRPSVRSIASAAVDDPVYLGGLRVLLSSSSPVLVVPSGPRDVQVPGELSVPIRANRKGYSHVRMDYPALGLPLPPASLTRELPGGAPDGDHSFAVRDLTYTAQLAAAVAEQGRPLPLLLPEHCADVRQLAEHDLIVVGGPDVNFWHAVLYEAVAARFLRPASSVPLALGMRSDRKGTANYNSVLIRAVLADIKRVFPNAEDDAYDIDDRLYPAHGMILACRNPYAAALGMSHWCVFVAGLTSVGTAGSVRALAHMLELMRSDSEADFFSTVPTASAGVHADVAAVLCRVVEVECPALRLNGGLVPRQRHPVPGEGRDPYYSDSGLPTRIQYLDFSRAEPAWRDLLPRP
ncbi:hypothetical protein GCM10020367_29070 [Streptomyces sannanensis]|uniref:Uncharacterized protein n=1 Tax=Streptomyces sannanensis TaxID=285536 RepID=A0ABP6SBB2_9ACTN